MDRGQPCNRILFSFVVFPEFVGPTIHALNGMLSGFIFLINLIDKPFKPSLMADPKGTSRRAVVTISKS